MFDPEMSFFTQNDISGHKMFFSLQNVIIDRKMFNSAKNDNVKMSMSKCLGSLIMTRKSNFNVEMIFWPKISI